jgi:hypothetical protein
MRCMALKVVVLTTRPMCITILNSFKPAGLFCLYSTWLATELHVSSVHIPYTEASIEQMSRHPFAASYDLGKIPFKLRV